MPDPPECLTWRQAAVATALGLAGAVWMWGVAPYNNFVLRNGYIADDYLPATAAFVIFLLVLGYNPLARRLAPTLALGSSQLALIFGILLVAAVPTSSGFLRMLPYALAQECQSVSAMRWLANYYLSADLPAVLFPCPMHYQSDVSVARWFLQKLPPGMAIPWRAWQGPMVAWSGFALPYWMMMVGLAAIVMPQWRDNERLAFPLLTVQRALIEAPAEGRRLPPLLTSRAFWAAAGAVFAVHLLNGLHVYHPQSFPRIRLNWSLDELFTEEPWRYIPFRLKNPQLYFLFLGVAFFASDRVRFSLWFVPLCYGVYSMLKTAYAPPYYPGIIAEHRTGAVYAYMAAILWLGRAHWSRVARALVRWGGCDEDRRNRGAGLLFALGVGGMWAWFVWTGVQGHWAALLVVMGVGYALVIARIVAETGLALAGLQYDHVVDVLRVIPVGWVRPATAWMFGAMAAYFGAGGRVCATVAACHAMGLEPQLPARSQTGRVWLLMGVMVAGLVLGWGVHLSMNYAHQESLDGRERPIGSWGATTMFPASALLTQQQLGKWDKPLYSRPWHMALGAAMVLVMQALCLGSPRWPLHPAGLIMVDTWFNHMVWASVLFGWVARRLILSFGGSRLYTAARPVFIGLILGEVAAAIFWGGVSAVLALADQPYRVVQVLPY